MQMVRRRCFFATLVGGRCSTVSTLHPVWTHSSVPTLPILFDYSHSVQGVTTGRLLSFVKDLKISSLRSWRETWTDSGAKISSTSHRGLAPSNSKKSLNLSLKGNVLTFCAPMT